MSIGIWQLLLIVLLVLLLFGAGKLPNVMSDLAKGVKNFKKGMEDEDTSSKTPKKITYDSESAKAKDKDKVEDR